MLSQSLATPAPIPKIPAISSKDIRCLTDNIYHEARNQSLQGQVAVGIVTLNRVKSKLFQSSICEVVYAPYQFSWTKDKHLRILEKDAWEIAKYAAYLALTSNYTFKALYYHTTEIRPYWAKYKLALVTIGQHKFYM